jgi:hypothetical protein
MEGQWHRFLAFFASSGDRSTGRAARGQKYQADFPGVKLMEIPVKQMTKARLGGFSLVN